MSKELDEVVGGAVGKSRYLVKFAYFFEDNMILNRLTIMKE